MNWMNLLFTVMLFAFPFGAMQAQTATATLSGADTVRQGEMLQLTFAFENVDAKDFEFPDIVGLTVVGGPSRQTSMSIMNGKRTSASAYVYRVIAEQPGLAYIPSVKVLHDEEEIKTEAISVFVTENADYVPQSNNEKAQPAPIQPKKRKRKTVKL